jgi:hypothetical protein
VLQVLARRHGLRGQEPVPVAQTTTRTANGVQTTTTTAGRASPRSAAQEEHVARVLVGMESRSYLSTLWNWTRALAGFVGGLAGATCLVVSPLKPYPHTPQADTRGQLLLCNLCLTAYDNALPLLRPESTLVSVRPAGYPWAYNVHLLCADPPARGAPGEADPTFWAPEVAGGGDQFPPDHKRPRKNHTALPTVLYEAPSGVPGSISVSRAESWKMFR